MVSETATTAAAYVVKPGNPRRKAEKALLLKTKATLTINQQRGAENKTKKKKKQNRRRLIQTHAHRRNPVAGTERSHKRRRK